MKHAITRDDLIAMQDYGATRSERRRDMAEMKKDRRIGVGPHATLYFENFETMWYQVHEMLWVEKGGEAQIEDELSAYNPLIPNGRELTATLMFEIDQRARRQEVLGQLGGVEDKVQMRIDGDIIPGTPELDVERSTEGGRASSVHFLHFPFNDQQVAAFRREGAEVLLGITHENYDHTVMLPQPLRQALSQDFE